MTKQVATYIAHTREELNALAIENGKLWAKDGYETNMGSSFFLTYCEDSNDVDTFGFEANGRTDRGSWDCYGDYPEKANVSVPKAVNGYNTGSIKTTGFVWKQVNDALAGGDMYYLTTTEHEGRLKVVADYGYGEKFNNRGCKYFVWYDVYFKVGTEVKHIKTRKWGVIRDFIKKCDA